MKGYRTVFVGLGMAVLPVALTYLLKVDWTQLVGPNAAMVVAGGLTIVMRMVTTTPPGQSS